LTVVQNDKHRSTWRGQGDEQPAQGGQAAEFTELFGAGVLVDGDLEDVGKRRQSPSHGSGDVGELFDKGLSSRFVGCQQRHQILRNAVEEHERTLGRVRHGLSVENGDSGRVNLSSCLEQQSALAYAGVGLQPDQSPLAGREPGHQPTEDLQLAFPADKGWVSETDALIEPADHQSRVWIAAFDR